MATLEKIRSKSVLLFTIIIVALLAFILGDFLTSGRNYFGHGTTIAKVAGHKVDATQIQAKVTELSQAAEAQGQTPDNELLRQQAIQELLIEDMMASEMDALGIHVTDAEITAGMTGPMPHRAVQQFIYQTSQALGLPNPSGQAIFDAISNPAKYNLDPEVAAQLRAAWAQQERDLEKAMRNERLGLLLSGLYTANPLDVRAMYDERNTTAHISYVAKDFTAIPDAEVKVSDADLRNTYNTQKELYRLPSGDAREISYIVVRLEPSAQDLHQAELAVNEAHAAIAADTSGVGSVKDNPAFVVNRFTTPRRGINNPILRSFVDSANVGQVKQLIHNNQGYTLGKLIGRTQQTDSVMMSFAMFQTAQERDSVITAINAGTLTFGQYLKENPGVGQDSIWDTMVGSQAAEAITEMLTTAPIGQVNAYTDSVADQTGALVPRHMALKVINRRAPVPVYDLAVVEYAVEPSTETVNALTAGLRNYVKKNNTPELFSKNASAAGYTTQTTLVDASTPMVGASQYSQGLEDSRPIVKWAMDNSKGAVSPVYEDKKQSYLIAAAVDDSYSDYIPYDSKLIADGIRQKTLNELKGHKMLAQYAGKAKDLAGYAKLMGTEAANTDVNFASPAFGNLGYGEFELQGVTAAAKDGQLVGPVQGNTRVVVLTVDGTTYNEPAKDRNLMDEYGPQFNQQQGFQAIFNGNGLFNALRGNQRVNNYSTDFEEAQL